MKSNLKHVLELIGISLRVVAACIGVLLFSTCIATTNDSIVALLFGIVTLISWDIYMLRTIIETFMPEFEYKDIGRKKFGSCVIWGYVLSIAAMIIMALNGWFISGYVKPESSGSKIIDILTDRAGVFIILVFWLLCVVHLLLLLISVIIVGLKK